MNGVYVHQLIHGEAKVGKTHYGCSGPGKTLVLDSEAGGMRFVPGSKVRWNVSKGEKLPDMTGVRICHAPINAVSDYRRVLDILESERHAFNNLSMDSLTEFQDRVKKERSATFQLQQQDWGVVFGVMNDIVVEFRDLVQSQDQLLSLTVICGTKFKDGLFRPMLSGQFQDKLPYKLDAVAPMIKVKDPDGHLRRALIYGESHEYLTGHRFGSNAPDIMWDPTITKLLNTVFETDIEENI